jgi:hypothetical protein
MLEPSMGFSTHVSGAWDGMTQARLDWDYSMEPLHRVLLVVWTCCSQHWPLRQHIPRVCMAGEPGGSFMAFYDLASGPLESFPPGLREREHSLQFYMEEFNKFTAISESTTCCVCQARRVCRSDWPYCFQQHPAEGNGDPSHVVKARGPRAQFWVWAKSKGTFPSGLPWSTLHVGLTVQTHGRPQNTPSNVTVWI